MSSQDAQEFLEFLHKNKSLRTQFKDAILDEIVFAGQLKGYSFTAEELKGVLPGPGPTTHSKQGGGGTWDYDERQRD